MEDDNPIQVNADLPPQTELYLLVDHFFAQGIKGNKYYVAVSLGDQKYQTPQSNNKSLVPRWTEKYQFTITHPTSLYVEVFAKQLIGKDKSLGHVRVNIDAAARSDAERGEEVLIHDRASRLRPVGAFTFRAVLSNRPAPPGLLYGGAEMKTEPAPVEA